MPDESSNFLGAMQNSSERSNSENVPHCSNYQQQSSTSSYLILSPANPLRTCAITFLTSWLYCAVIISTICAFVISSTFSNFWCEDDTQTEVIQSQTHFNVLTWTRRIIFIVILLEMLIKSVARGFLVGKLSYLRLAWDWLDVISLALIFVSMIIPWKALDSLAAGIVLLKLIPLHTGSINAFISLCSCAKNLIPVLVYWIIIVWIYGIVIFTLFVKYQQDIFEDGDSRNNGSVTKTSDSVENENITQKSHVGAFVEGDYLTPSTSKKSQNFSFGLSVECLPTNLRSLSGSIIQVWSMLTFGFTQSDLSSKILQRNTSNLVNHNKLESLCQYEIYTLSIVETLVIISGTLPMITMIFGALYDFFQKESSGTDKLLVRHDDNETEQDAQTFDQYHQRRRLGSGVSGRSTNSHSQNDCDEGSSCLTRSFNQLANMLCDCDYYFCCLASLQRRLNPCASRILNSKRFKVCVMLVVTLDFLCMIMLLWFCNDQDIDFSPAWLITYCLQICFVLYTVEAVYKWFALSSDEYWLNIWSAFDLILVIIYWIGYTIIHVGSYQPFYPHFCGILIIRMLKVVPYSRSLQLSLKVMVSSLSGKRHHLFVILTCSCSVILLKYAFYMSETDTKRSSQNLVLDYNSSSLFYFHIFVKHFSYLILYFLCSAVIVCIFIQTIDILNVPQGKPRVNASVSFLLNDSYMEELASMHSQLPRRSLNESASPISIMTLPSGGISPMKYRFAASPSRESTNRMLQTQETQSMLSPSSDVLSPFLSIPAFNGLNGHVQPSFDESCHNSEVTNAQLVNDSCGNEIDHEGQHSFHVRCSYTERFLDFATSAVTILSSVNIALDSSNTGENKMTWDSIKPGRSLWLEMLFILTITAHIIYKTKLSRFSRETFLQLSCVCDLLMILGAAVEVFSSGMKWLPLESVKVFVNCAKVLSACRGLMLFSRISWLQCVGSSLCNMLGDVARYIVSFGYLWLLFMICSSEAQKLIMSVTTKDHQTDDKGGTNTFFSNDSDRKTNFRSIANNDFIPHSSLIVLTILLFLISFGGFMGLFIHKFGGWHEALKKYASQTWGRNFSLMPSKLINSTSQINKPTEGICVPVLYFVTNHLNFDIIVMGMILCDALVITLEHLATSDRAYILRRHYPAYILFWYLLEFMCKLGGNGLHFFKSNWNIFDSVVILVSLTDFFVSLIWQNHYLPVLILNMRFLRVLRIFQFTPFVQRAEILQKFSSSIPKVFFMLRNFAMFYFSLFLVAIIFRLRCSQFVPMEQNALLLITAPFQVLDAQSILGVMGKFNLNVESTLFFCCLLLLSLIRISVIFSTWLVLTAILCHMLSIQRQEVHHSANDSNRFHDQHPEPVGRTNGSVDFDDKSSFLMPCISPETIDIETPSSSGTTNRLNSSYAAVGSANIEEPVAVHSNNQNNPLYKTTTITSSEEINGCKVFYVDLITTV